jgi:hypothetical protein
MSVKTLKFKGRNVSFAINNEGNYEIESVEALVQKYGVFMKKMSVSILGMAFNLHFPV